MKNGKLRVRWRNVLLGTGMGGLILVCGCAAAAGLLSTGTLGMSHVDLLAAGILAAAALGGCLTAAPGGSPADAALTAVGMLVVLLALNAVLNGGKMEGMGVTALVLAGGCGAALLLGMNRSGGRKKSRRRRRNR